MQVCVGFQEKLILQDLKPLENTTNLSFFAVRNNTYFLMSRVRCSHHTSEMISSNIVIKMSTADCLKKQDSKYLSVFCHKARYL